METVEIHGHCHRIRFNQTAEYHKLLGWALLLFWEVPEQPLIHHCSQILSLKLLTPVQMAQLWVNLWVNHLNLRGMDLPLSRGHTYKIFAGGASHGFALS